jgi:hypothetical protein
MLGEIKTNMKQIIEEYDILYDMLLCTTIMSNTKVEEFKKDAKQIIQLIGNAYEMSSKLIEQYQNIIIGKLMELELASDRLALYSERNYSTEVSGEDILFDVKGDVLTELQNLSESDRSNFFIKKDWFNYNLYIVYNPSIRFSKIRAASVSGNIIITRQCGLLHLLGIGCTKDMEEAKRRLLQCTLWGDIMSMYLLAYAYKLEGNKEKAKLFYEVAELSEKYLFSGITVLPQVAKEKYSEDACTYFVYISTILQDIIVAHGKTNIDFSFVEAITSESLDYFERMGYINNYEKKEWKNVTNSSERPTKEIGF